MADKIVATLQFDEGEPLYDIDHALVMCQLHKFHRGTLYLYKKKSLYEEILKHYMEMSDLDQVVNTCRRFGDQNPALWTKTLQFVAKDCTAQPEQVTSLSIRGSMVSNHWFAMALYVPSQCQLNLNSNRASLGRRVLKNKRDIVGIVGQIWLLSMIL